MKYNSPHIEPCLGRFCGLHQGLIKMVSVIHPLLINPWFTPTPLFDRITKVFMKCLVHALQLSLRIRGDRWDRGQLGGYSRTSHRPSRILPWAGPPFTRHGRAAFYPGPGHLLPSTTRPGRAAFYP